MSEEGTGHVHISGADHVSAIRASGCISPVSMPAVPGRALRPLATRGCRHKGGGTVRATRMDELRKSRTVREAHDALLRALAGDETCSASLIRRFAPPELPRVFSDRPPRLPEVTLVRPGQGKIQTDALFLLKLCCGDNVPVHILFEHLSSPSPGRPLSLLEYRTTIWRQRNQSIGLRSLLPIIPIVIYPGRCRGAVPDSFLPLIQVPEVLSGKLPLLDFGIGNHDLGLIPDAELADDPATRGALLAMKITHAEDPPIETVLEIMLELATRPEESLVRKEGVRYVLDTLKLSDEHHMALPRAQDQEDRDMALKTIAERLALQGRSEGQANLILMLLEERFGLLPADAVERDRSADIAEWRRGRSRCSTRAIWMESSDLPPRTGPATPVALVAM